MSADDYGRYYWTIELKDGRICIDADRLEVTPNGSLIAYGHHNGEEDKEMLLFAWADKQWKYIYAASILDGGAIACEHWFDDSKDKKDKIELGGI